MNITELSTLQQLFQRHIAYLESVTDEEKKIYFSYHIQQEHGDIKEDSTLYKLAYDFFIKGLNQQLTNLKTTLAEIEAKLDYFTQNPGESNPCIS